LLPNVWAGKVAARAQIPLVVSPRGMLAPAALQYSSLKKRIFWRLLQEPVIRQASFHATSTEEYDDIRAAGLSGPVAIVPNGIDLPDLPDVAEPREGDRRRGARRTLLSLGRIHPKKGLDRLLHAWSGVEAAHPDWWLKIVGPAEGRHDEELRALARALGLGRFSIEGPIYGDAKAAAYSEADLFVLPTLNENFGISLAEALAAGVPAICTRGAPWAGLEIEGCGWWVEHGVEPLGAALTSAMALPSAVLRRMGAKGRAWMGREFSWDRVAGDMLAVYRWLACGAECPASVRVD
jgi:glycosyltransferase involved in cell wall biosynthesis